MSTTKKLSIPSPFRKRTLVAILAVAVVLVSGFTIIPVGDPPRQVIAPLTEAASATQQEYPAPPHSVQTVRHPVIPTTTTTTKPPAPPTTKPPAPVKVESKVVATSSSGGGDPASDASWDRLAQCEAGGNWAINTGNGYYGGLQFSLSSWRAVDGPGYPHENSREVQIEMGKRLYASGGWGHWPGCTRSFGWR